MFIRRLLHSRRSQFALRDTARVEPTGRRELPVPTCALATLLSVNVRLPRDIERHGRILHTGIWKDPVRGRCGVRRLNLDGDGEGDLAAHGGEQQAVFAYQLESSRCWRQQLGRSNFVHGQFGENFTIEDLADNDLCGSTRILADMTAMLATLGVPPDRIHTEIFNGGPSLMPGLVGPPARAQQYRGTLEGLRVSKHSGVRGGLRRPDALVAPKRCLAQLRDRSHFRDGGLPPRTPGAARRRQYSAVLRAAEPRCRP